MTVTYINDATDVVVNKINVNIGPHISMDITDGAQSGFTTGMLVGMDSTPVAQLADARSTVLLPAHGVVIMTSQQPWTIGENTGNYVYDRLDVYKDNITMKLTGGITFTPGQVVWLSSGGGITQNYPQGIGNLRQQVGWAIATDTWVVGISTADVIQV